MHETNSIKSLACNALERLERNKLRNKSETNVIYPVSQTVSHETKNEGHLSGLSVPFEGSFYKKLENRPGFLTDKTDRFKNESNMSVLSVPSQGAFEKNLENIPPFFTDKTDKSGQGGGLSGLSGSKYGISDQNSLDASTLSDDYEERLAIAEYDGQQPPLQAARIAYQDAFIAVLTRLPFTEEPSTENWLDQRIKAAKEWLLAQGFKQPD